MKKKFKDTKVGKFLSEKAPSILDTVGELLPESGVLGVVGNLIEKSSMSEEDKIVARSHIKEMYEIEVADRESARDREVEIKKSGRQDIMMVATGIVGLLSFVFMIYAVVYEKEATDNDLFVHLMGMIEGVVISNIFAYYYGKSHNEKA